MKTFRINKRFFVDAKNVRDAYRIYKKEIIKDAKKLTPEEEKRVNYLISQMDFCKSALRNPYGREAAEAKSNYGSSWKQQTKEDLKRFEKTYRQIVGDSKIKDGDIFLGKIDKYGPGNYWKGIDTYVVEASNKDEAIRKLKNYANSKSYYKGIDLKFSVSPGAKQGDIRHAKSQGEYIV